MHAACLSSLLSFLPPSLPPSPIRLLLSPTSPSPPLPLFLSPSLSFFLPLPTTHTHSCPLEARTYTQSRTYTYWHARTNRYTRTQVRRQVGSELQGSVAEIRGHSPCQDVATALAEPEGLEGLDCDRAGPGLPGKGGPDPKLVMNGSWATSGTARATGLGSDLLPYSQAPPPSRAVHVPAYVRLGASLRACVCACARADQHSRQRDGGGVYSFQDFWGHPATPPNKGAERRCRRSCSLRRQRRCGSLRGMAERP